MTATTINMHMSVHEKISDTAKYLSTSQRDIAVKYQDDDLKENWHCFHVKLSDDEYDFFIDLRKFYRLSVSRLLALAVKKYLSQVISEFKMKLVDNYVYFKHYDLNYEVGDGYIAWKIYWRTPESMSDTVL
jgi:hypothetical protein